MLIFVVSLALQIVPPSEAAVSAVSDEMVQVEKKLINTLSSAADSRAKAKQLSSLILQQNKYMKSEKKRLKELEDFVTNLESRRQDLRERVTHQRDAIRKRLIKIVAHHYAPVYSLNSSQSETIEAPRRRVLANLVDWSVKEIEALRADLTDADELEAQIEEERSQIAYVVQNLQEQEDLIEFHKKLQTEVLRKKHEERLAQLESYQKIKSREQNLSQLIKQFQARQEFEKIENIERNVQLEMAAGSFLKAKSALKFPVSGNILTRFGKSLDPTSRLSVFKKGIDIAGQAGEDVKAIYSGKVVYSGKLPEYSDVVIIDHGSNYYSLCAKLGKVDKKVGDYVAQGEVIGKMDTEGTPIYFEIRSRNVPVDPLQWAAR